MSSAKVAIIIYTMYGHIYKLAESVKAGVESAGGKADIYQVPETLSKTVLDKMHAPPKPDIPVASVNTLTEYDAFIFGIPTRYGNMPAQWKAFWDATGLGGGQETTVLNTLSTFTHHGIIYVPLGYKHAFTQFSKISEVRGGSPWGAGTLAGSDGSRQPSSLELEIANIQGKSFYETVSKVSF